MPPTPPNIPTRSRRADEADGVRLGVAPAPGARRSRRRSARLQPKLANKPMPPLPSTLLRPEGRAPERNVGAPPHQSQRDCGLQLRVARHELPWVAARENHNPNGVATGLPTGEQVQAKASPWNHSSGHPRPVRHERGEGRGEGCPTLLPQVSLWRRASSPRPSPPFRTEERETEVSVRSARPFAKSEGLDHPCKPVETPGHHALKS